MVVKQIKIDLEDYDRLKKYAYAGEAIRIALKNLLDENEEMKRRLKV
jgi:hypothetical protein